MFRQQIVKISVEPFLEQSNCSVILVLFIPLVQEEIDAHFTEPEFTSLSSALQRLAVCH